MATDIKSLTVGQSIILNETDVAKIKLDRTRRPYKDGTSRAGQFYYIGNYMGLGIAIEDADYQLFDKGQVAELSLEFTSYERPDPVDPTKMVPRNGFRIISLITWEQLIGVEGNRMKLDELRATNAAKLKSIAAKAEAEIAGNQINEELMATLLAAAGAAGAAEAKKALVTTG